MYILDLTIQCCFYFEQSRTPHRESQQTDNLMVQMWTNLVRPEATHLGGGYTQTYSDCFLSHINNELSAFQLQSANGQRNIDSGKATTLLCPTEVC